MTACQQCGRSTQQPVRGRCNRCKPKPPPGVSIKHPTDDEQEFLFDQLIRQRSQALKPENYCHTDGPQEELEIRRKLKL